MPRMMMRFERTVMPISGLRGWWIVPLLSLVNLAAAGSDVRLVEAVQNQDKEAVRALLKQDVDVNTPQADGATALAWAAYWDDLDTANLLIRAGANVNIANDFGVTPLSLACTNGNAAMVETLLNAGADPNVAAFTTRETVLITAARTGSVQHAFLRAWTKRPPDFPQAESFSDLPAVRRWVSLLRRGVGVSRFR